MKDRDSYRLGTTTPFGLDTLTVAKSGHCPEGIRTSASGRPYPSRPSWWFVGAVLGEAHRLRIEDEGVGLFRFGHAGKAIPA